MGRLARISWIYLAACLIAGAARAQDFAQLVQSADKTFNANQFAKALEQYLAIPDTAALEHRLAKHTGAAITLVNMGRANEGAVHIELARTMVEQVGTDVARVRFFYNEGIFLSVSRRGDRGLASLLKAAEIAEHSNAPNTTLAKVYGGLASVHQGLEDWERFTYFNQKEFDLLEQPTAANRLEYHIGRGIAFFEMYERDAAEQEFQRSVELSAESERLRDRAFALGELAFLYWTFDKDVERALPLYTEAIALADQTKSAGMTANWLTNRGNVHRDTGDYTEAESDYQAAIRILDAGGLNTGFHIRKNVAQVWRLQGRTREAADALAKLIAERGQSALMRHLWQAHMEAASAYATLGERDRAETHFRVMLEVLEEQRNTAILDAFRTGTLAHQLSAYDPYERYIRFLVEANPPRADEALAIAERARARGFLEALATVRGAVAAKLPPALLTEESRIRRAISSVQEQLRAADLAKADRDRLVAELERAEQEREKFLINLRVEHPSLAEARYPTLLDTPSVQAALRPDEIAVAFFLAEPDSFRWVLSKEHVIVDRVAGRNAIQKTSIRLRDLLRAPSNRDEAAQVSAELSGMLFAGISTADDRPMVVIPHGALNYVPFEVLPVQGKMLVERHAVSYAPSLNALVQLRRSPSNTAPFRVLAVGNPAIANAPPSTERGDVENLALLGSLPFAEQELHAIGRTFRDRTRILSGASARESGLRDGSMPQYPVLHFATHGLVSDVQPKRSGLLLAPETGEDGLLQMSEIYGLGLKANLVVLSACQTALGREITGEGLIGLSRAFFYAGARSVVATLWNLNDRFAAEFVERFYSELNQGHSSEEALRRAKVAYANHPRYSHPFYWASPVMLGDGTAALVSEPLRPPRVPLLLAIGVTLLAIVISVAKVRKTV